MIWFPFTVSLSPFCSLFSLIICIYHGWLSFFQHCYGDCFYRCLAWAVKVFPYSLGWGKCCISLPLNAIGLSKKIKFGLAYWWICCSETLFVAIKQCDIKTDAFSVVSNILTLRQTIILKCHSANTTWVHVPLLLLDLCESIVMIDSNFFY